MRGGRVLAVALAAVTLAGVAAAAPTTALVQIHDQGFVPSEIEIVQGEAVAFENRGREPHWPASNIHPTHQVYPEFDPRQPVLPGQRWTFVFERPGTWPFHDHLHPEAGGRIEVRPRPGAVRSIWQARVVAPLQRGVGAASGAVRVSVARAYYRVFPGELARVLGNFNIRAVAADDDALRYWLQLVGLKRMEAILLERSGGGNAFDCHQYAHQLGRVAYALYGAAAFRDVDDSCGSGLYHGAMEGFLTERGTTNFAREITALCRRLETRFARMQCHHGAGHGVMAYEGYNLPKALETCGRLPEAEARRPCYDGVFMENVVAGQGFGALRGHKSPWLSADPHFPCNAVGDTYELRFHCYHMQTSWMISLLQDFDRVVHECLKAPADVRGVCFESFGRDVASVTLRDRAGILRLCGRVPRQGGGYEECISGAVTVIVGFWGEGLRDQASQVCRDVADTAKPACYRTIAGWLGSIFTDPARRRQVCETFEALHREACLRGSG
jgi:plastocyanin